MAGADDPWELDLTTVPTESGRRLHRGLPTAVHAVVLCLLASLLPYVLPATASERSDDRTFAWAILLAMVAVAASFAHSLLESELVAFDGTSFTVTRSGLFGSRRWRAPLATYLGVQCTKRRVRILGRSHQTYYGVDLVHTDRRRNVKLYESWESGEWRDKSLEIARRLSVPVLQVVDGRLIERDADELGRTVEELLAERAQATAAATPERRRAAGEQDRPIDQPPSGRQRSPEVACNAAEEAARGRPRGVRVATEDGDLVVTIARLKPSGIFASLFLAVAGGIFGWFFLQLQWQDPNRSLFQWVASVLLAVALPGIGLNLLVWSLSRPRIRVGPASLRLSAVLCGRELGRKRIAVRKTDSLSIEGSPPGLRIGSAGGAEVFGSGLPRPTLAWLRDAILEQAGETERRRNQQPDEPDERR